MNRRISVSYIILLVGLIVSIGSSSALAAGKKKYNFRYATSLPANGWGAVHSVKPWMKQVEEVTDGQVTFTPYWSQALMKSRAMWGGLKTGIVDIADVSFHYWPGLVDIHNVISLPFLEYQSAEHESIVAWKLYEKFPEIRNEYKDNKILLFYASTPFFFISNKKQIHSRNDFKGLKIRVAGGESLRYMVESGGGIPISVGGPEVYSALEKNIIDASMANWDFLQVFRLYEVAKYYFHGPFNAGARGVVMSQQAWNRLTPDLQAKIQSISGLKGSRFWARTSFDDSVAPGKERVKSEGYKLIESTASPREVAEWKAAYSDKIWGTWKQSVVLKAKKEGYPNPEALADNVLKTTLQLITTTAN